ncbi:phenoloxidase-activating factor 2 [Drosophila biarmipes]|uniref:phenoloxidase-activating factor 2 n=1 Tax=Drosophila biarmipes TaxID=125945 RepID=UPI0007E60B04|nr:phenoloxidase-activating factor 2 [Drosophila biarmipes]XP_043950139.1 phenoloxidase-activating factor 2 [Drosophila biarmipes]XP_043950140.1 phenoloxidase-activating factor 2 [Drosophila biarmipes]
MILLSGLITCACIFICAAQGNAHLQRTTPGFYPKVPSSNLGSETGPQYKSCGSQRECVPRWLCANGTANTDGHNLIDIRIDTGSECQSYLEQCCDVLSKRAESIFPTDPETPEGCGYQNKNGVGFKITGAVSQEAEFGEFPWMLAILIEDRTRNENLYECGGALLAPNVVLTAAHCVRNKQPGTLIVRAGEWDTSSFQEVLPHEDRYVRQVVSHEQFNKGALHNDVAVMLLESPFTSQANIQPVCLPHVGEIFDYDRCYVTGWGTTKFGQAGQYQVILKKVDLPVVPAQQCQSSLRETRLGRLFDLHDSFICAGGEGGKDTCKGDGGSPLVCPIKGQKDRFVSAGIVAWGIGCGQQNIPGMYANVAKLRPWIEEKLRFWNIDPKHYTP